MFGFLTPSQEYLSPEEEARYRSWYCGLCRVIGQRHSQLSRLTLTYDLTFLAVLLSSLYEPEENSGTCVCPMHPLKAHSWCTSEFSAYAADIGIALSYYKCLDNWNDECDPLMLAASKLFRQGSERVAIAYPRQMEAIRTELENLAQLEAAGETNPDLPAACFGRLLGEVFVYSEDDYWAGGLRSLGNQLGRLIYLMDAALDLEQDRKRARYNPFSALAQDDGTEQFLREVLNITLGDCVLAFDRLPLVQDAAILKNILCVGVWTQYNSRKKAPQEGKHNVSGSV